VGRDLEDFEQRGKKVESKNNKKVNN